MADPLLRFKPVKHKKDILLAIDGRASNNSWKPLMTIRPQVRVTGQDTLNLDIFVPRVTWQSSDKNARALVLQGQDGAARITTRVTLHSYDMLRVETRVSFSRPVRLEMARDCITLVNFPVEHSWSPHQTPLHEMVIGDVVFRAPVVMAQSDQRVVAVLPNLRSLASQRTVPTALTFNAGTPEISYGCVPYRLSRSTYYVHYDTDTVDLSRRTIRYSYFIYFQNNCRPREGTRRVAHRLWRLYAASQPRSITPQYAPLEECSDYAHQWSLEKWKAGNNVLSMDTAVRAAFGMALSARRGGRDTLLKCAAEIKELALEAPQEDGLFPILYKPPSTHGRAKGEWMTGALCGPPRREDLCRLANTSTACYWLCRWHREIEKDARIPAFAANYAERLIKLQKHGGHIPAWVDPSTGKTARFCARSAETAVHAIFLAELYRLDPNSEYIRAARRAVNFVIREIAATGRWENTEAFCTSSPQWKEKKPLRRDPIQQHYTSHALALWWAAEALLRLYEVTGTFRYIQHGERVLDELSLYQQIWNPPFVAVPCFGGFGSMNTDGQWHDASQALFAKTYMDYYSKCGRTEYFKRGVGALRASFALMNCPENGAAADLFSPSEASKPGRLAPYCRLEVPGDPKTCLPAPDDFDWEAGTAACASEDIRQAYGDLYVDTRRQQAFGINGIVVTRVEADLAGLAVYGREALGQARSIVVRTETGQSFTVKLKKSADFEIQV